MLSIQAPLCLQTGASDFAAIPEIDFDIDIEEATASGGDAFAELVQMAVREDPSLANLASTSGRQTTVYLRGLFLAQSCL